MKKVNIWESGVSKSTTYINDVDDIIKYIKESKNISFSVIDQNGLQDGSITTQLVDIVNKNAKEQNVEVTYVDGDHPFFYDQFDDIYFSKEFFDKNKAIILEAIEDVMFNQDSVFISKYAYSDELVKNLCLTATSICFDNEIKVPDEVKKILKRNHINAYSYKNGERQEISSNEILGQDYNNVISDSDDLYIKNNVTDLENLKYIPKNKTIHIDQVNKFKLGIELSEDYDSLYNIISKLRENGQHNKVVISIRNRNAFSKSKLYNSDFDFTVEGVDIEPYKIDDLKKEDELLDLMVRDIKNANYSPFEKYLAAYNIVKKFKKYLENSEDKTQSRNIRKLLNNDYMVCVGYANLLQELLKRLDIPVYEYNVLTDTSYDKGFTLEEKPVELAGHARVILYINDPKYDISGFYVADPTWDNDLLDDYYNHALMSFDKTGQEKRLFELSKEDIVMNCKSMEEFSSHVNFLLNRYKKNQFSSLLNKDEKQKETNAIKSLVDIINNILISLMPEKYLELKKKYPSLTEPEFNIDEVYNFITEAGEIFIDNLGKDVSIDTVIEAASVVNKDIFGFDEEQLNEYKKDLLDKNIKMDKIAFPYYYDNNINIKK